MEVKIKTVKNVAFSVTPDMHVAIPRLHTTNPKARWAASSGFRYALKPSSQYTAKAAAYCSRNRKAARAPR